MVSGCPLFRGNFILKSRWEFESCPLSGIKKRPLLGGYLCIRTIVISIRNTAFVRCRKVVRSVMGGSTAEQWQDRQFVRRWDGERREMYGHRFWEPG